MLEPTPLYGGNAEFRDSLYEQYLRDPASVAERWREMGLRIALGAGIGQTMRTIAMPGVVLTIAGLVSGSLLSYPAMQAIQALVWGIQPSNPANFVIAGLVLLVVALTASFAPAIRLRRLNMADTLREG